jgi:hypothetical protein
VKTNFVYVSQPFDDTGCCLEKAEVKCVNPRGKVCSLSTFRVLRCLPSDSSINSMIIIMILVLFQ